MVFEFVPLTEAEQTEEMTHEAQESIIRVFVPFLAHGFQVNSFIAACLLFSHQHPFVVSLLLLPCHQVHSSSFTRHS